jgi:hypothetical protein
MEWRFESVDIPKLFNLCWFHSVYFRFRQHAWLPWHNSNIWLVASAHFSGENGSLSIWVFDIPEQGVWEWLTNALLCTLQLAASVD